MIRYMSTRVRAKKSLGQNFLRNRGALRVMIEAGKLQPGDTVLEIGPGDGTLTRELLMAGAHVIAVEKDDRLIPILKAQFESEISSGSLTLIHSDILSFDPYTLYPTPYTLTANIPYYITGAVLEKFLSASAKPERVVLMVQKEVAERIVARDGKESILSISVKVFGSPQIVRKVPRGSFVPVPNVDSAVLLVEKIRNPFRSQAKKKNFFELVRKGFRHKRKLLRGNLNLSPKEAEALFQVCLIQTNARAENLTLQQWECLTDRIGPAK